eukprot:100848_1
MSSKKSKETVKVTKLIPKSLESIKTAIYYHHNAYHIGYLMQSSRKYGFYKSAEKGLLLRIEWINAFCILDLNFQSNILGPNEIVKGFLAFNKDTQTFERVFAVNSDTYNVKFDEKQLP